jgi:septum formation protein
MSRGVSPLILASGSPRRLELLTQAGVEFSVIVPGCDETPVVGESAREMVERLALMKASAIAELHPDAYVLGADTTVYIGGVSLGKPESVEEAYQMLETIQGKAHEVWGGIAVVHRAKGIRESWSHMTRVTMAPMDRETIREYVASGEPMDKAGSYAIQGLGLRFVAHIEGSYSNVVGLNLTTVMDKFRELSCR